MICLATTLADVETANTGFRLAQFAPYKKSSPKKESSLRRRAEILPCRRGRNPPACENIAALPQGSIRSCGDAVIPHQNP